METVRIQIRNPVALWYKIRELIDAHYRVVEHISFMKQYPEVYHIYLTLKDQSAEVQRQSPFEADFLGADLYERE